MVGGYKVIDLKNINLSTVQVKIPGLYHKIESSVGKPILLRGITVNGVDRHSAYCQVGTYGQEFLLTYSIEASGNMYYVRVSQEDLVRYVQYVPTQAQDPSVNGEDGPSASM